MPQLLLGEGALGAPPGNYLTWTPFKFSKEVIILRVLINDKLSADINLKLNMFAWLGLLMAHSLLLKIGFKKISQKTWEAPV